MNIELLREEFLNVEKNRFNIVNKYIMGIVEINDIECFKVQLENFRNKLYTFNVNEENVFEIAKMKSKIQHFNTEILEDEDILRIAYNNSILLYRKVISE